MSRKSTNHLPQISPRYQLLEKLGEGGMGVVYKAHDTRLMRFVALKILHNSLFQDEKLQLRFLHEARAASALNHPNICTVFDAEVASGTPYIAMEFVEGKSLREILNSQQKIAPQEAIHIAAQICEALQIAHRKGIIHRDIKPDNIMVTHDGLVKVLDFGLAKFKFTQSETQPAVHERDEDAAAIPALYSFSGISGTAAYMSPEQIENKPVDERTDIFSLGVLIYEMLTGTLPFTGRNYLQVLNAILTQKPAPVAKNAGTVMTALQKVIFKALKKNREHRYSNISAFKEALQAALKLPQTITPQKTGGSANRFNFKKRLSTLLLSVGLFVVLLTMAKSWQKAVLSPISADKIVTILMPEYQEVSNHRTTRDAQLAVAIWEDMFLKLSSIKGIIAIPITQSQGALRGTQPAGDGPILNADYVLIGNLSQESEQIILSQHLLRYSSRDTLLSRSFSAAKAEIFHRQGEMALQLLTAMRFPLSNEERERLISSADAQFDAQYFYLRGRAYISQRYETNFISAIEMFKHCLKIEPRYAAAHAGLAEAYLAQYDWYIQRDVALMDSARNRIDRAFQINPDSPEAHIAQGDLFRLQGEPERNKAVQEYITALCQRNNNPDFVFKLLRLYRELGDFNQALVWGKKYLQLQPLSADAYVEIALLYWFQGKYEQSEENYEQAINLQPDSPNTLGQKAYYYLLRGEWDKADLQYRKTLAADPQSRQALSSLGLIAFCRNRPLEAISWYHKLDKTVSEGMDLYFLSCIYHKIGNTNLSRTMLDSALAVSQHAILKSPLDHLYLSEMAVIHAARGDRHAAREYIEKAKMSRDFQANYLRKNRVLLREAMVYSLIGEMDKSLTDIELLVSMHIYSPAFLQHCLGLENVRKDRRFSSVTFEQLSRD